MPQIDMDKALAELPVLRDFIDFVNRQVGVYSDCLAGFQGNKVRIERQVARVTHPVSQRIENGQSVIVWASVEDPSRPDVIHHRIIRADEFINANSEASFNEQQVCWAIIVFLFAYWDEKVRPHIAKIRGVKPSEAQADALGDLRILRNVIVHNAGMTTAAEHAKLKTISDICKPDATISLTHDQMHKVFVEVKKAIGNLILEYTGHLPGAPKPGEIVEVAIQNGPR
jgi:hypothetical protein